MKDGTYPSGKQPGLFSGTDKNSFVDYEFVMEEKTKLLKAFSDIAILTEIAKRSALSALDIIVFFKENYDAQISPGMVYSILRRLERSGYIRVLPYRRKRFYVLADSGRKALESLQQRFEDIQSFIVCSLSKEKNQRGM
jgi:DNA-binding PadR family transcriptional regulator